MMSLRRHKHTRMVSRGAWGRGGGGTWCRAEHGGGSGQLSASHRTRAKHWALGLADGTDGARRGKAAGIGPHILAGNRGTEWTVSAVALAILQRPWWAQ